MKKTLLYIGIIAIAIISSCKKETKIEGPELVDIFGDFKFFNFVMTFFF